MKINKYFFLISFFFSFFAFSIDQGDKTIHFVASWNQDLHVAQGRYQASYAFWDDFSAGPVFEHNQFFMAPALGVTWHLEPFEITTHAGPLFWKREGIKKTVFQISLHAQYLIQITTHFQALVSAGVNLPDQFFRGVPIGLGMRYWF